MRRLALAAVLGALIAACSATPDTPFGSADTPAPSITTSAPPTAAPSTVVPSPPTTSTTTVPPVPAVTFRLSAQEALAASRGVSVRVEDSAGSHLGALEGEGRLEAAITEGEVVRFVYLTPEGTATDVAWEQTVRGDQMIVAQPWRIPGTATGDVALVWQSLGDTGVYIRQLDGAPGVTIVSPIWWFVQADGGISDQSAAAYVAAVHDRGVQIWPAVAGLDADANHELLADPERRSAAAALIAGRAESIGADGVNLDIEGYREEDAAAFLLFAQEMTDLVHAWGGTVSYDLIPRSDSWDIAPVDLAFWSTAPPRREIASIVDYTVLMAYDQHNRYRPAGPVAAPEWVEDTLVYVLRYADPHTVLLGLPFYGRIWDPDELDKPRARGVGSIADVAAGGIATFDPTFGLDRVTLDDGRFLWREDPALLADRVTLVDDFGLAGWAAWRLGFDSPDLWDVLAAPG